MVPFTEVLESKGVVGILVSLYDQELTYSEILDEVDISSTTLTTRLTEMEEKNFIDLQATHRHGQRTQEYYLTERGFRITQMLAQEGVVKNYRKMMTHKETVEEGVQDVIEEIEQDIAGFMTDESDAPKRGRKIFQEYGERASDEPTITVGPIETSKFARMFGNSSDDDSDEEEDRDSPEPDDTEGESEQTEDAWGDVVGEEDSDEFQTQDK